MDWNWERHFDSRESFREHDRYEATVVPHPFGRGQFRELAMKAVIPKIVLDAIVNKHGGDPSWSSSTTWEGGGAIQRHKMSGVKRMSTHGNAKPKTSCRGRALKMRAEKSRMPRPGAGLPVRVSHTVCIVHNVM